MLEQGILYLERKKENVDRLQFENCIRELRK